MAEKKFNVKYGVLLPIVLLVTLFLWCVPVSFFGIDALTVVQQRVIALFVFAALMWMFEIIPNWATSVLIIVVALLTVSDKGLGFFCNPEFGQLVSYKKIMSSFADPVVMLFLGGFVLAIMAERFGLDVTLAKSLLSVFGTKPKMVLLGFLIIISVFSMFMSNTATAAMMLAFLAPVLHKLPSDDKGKIGLALSIPVAANLGGIGTPIGTPPNATAKGYLEQAGIDVSFGDWCVHMIPYVIIMILLAWILLLVFFPFKTQKLVLEIPANDKKKDWKSRLVWATFIITILLWATEQLHHISSNVVALIPLAVFTATGTLRQGGDQGNQLVGTLARCRRLRVGLPPSGHRSGEGSHYGDTVRLDVCHPCAGSCRSCLLLPLELHQQLRHRGASHPYPYRSG